MTGLEPSRTGVLTNVDGASVGKGLKVESLTIAKAAKAAGYSTGYFGKWHLGSEKNGLKQFGWDVYETGSDEAVSAKAAAWIRTQKGPWFAWVSVLNPHHIYDLKQVKLREGVKPPHSGLQDLESKPAEQRQFIDEDQGKAVVDYKPEDWLRYRSYYLDLLEKTDACLGTVLDAVGEAPSIVTYTSDHGDGLGEHGLPFKGPFMYEELIRIPMIIKAPGRIKPGERSELTTQADLACIIAMLAGLRGLPTSSVYSASKSAMQSFLEASRIELAPYGVAVTTVNPGFVATPMTEKNRFRMPFLMGPDQAARIIARGLERRGRVVEFPLPMSLLMRMIRLLPDAVFDRLTGPYSRRKVDSERATR